MCISTLEQYLLSFYSEMISCIVVFLSFNSKDMVVDCFMELVRDVNQNGAVVKCSKMDGIQYTSIEVKPVT